VLAAATVMAAAVPPRVDATAIGPEVDGHFGQIVAIMTLEMSGVVIFIAQAMLAVPRRGWMDRTTS
jgi:hypothetical protein